MRENDSTPARPPPTEPVALRHQGWEQQFGRGYAVGFAVFFITCIVSIAAALLFDSIRWLAVAVCAFGGGWAFGITYHAVHGIGFPSGNLRRPHVLRREGNPIGYWLVVVVLLASSGAIVGFGVWVWVTGGALATTRTDWLLDARGERSGP